MNKVLITGSVLNTQYVVPNLTELQQIVWKIIGQWSLTDGSTLIEVNVPDDALIILEFDTGAQVYLTIDEARQRYQLDFRDVSPLLKIVRVLQLERMSLSQQAPLNALAQLEQSYAKYGLYQLTSRTQFSTKPINSAPLIKRTQPLLLLIPDALQRLDNSFGTLWQSRSQYNANAYLERFIRPYGQQVFGIEYSAFSTSLASTLQRVVELLPQGAEIHCLGYGVGGVLAEVLAQASANIWNDKVYAQLQSTNASDLALNLKKLVTQLQTKQITISKVITLGAPLRGWALAHLSLSALVTWLNAYQTSDNKTSTVLTYRLAWLGLAQQLKLIASDLVGLQELQPDSPLIRLLNNPSTVIDGQSAHLISSHSPNALDQWLAEQVSEVLANESSDGMVADQATQGGMERKEGRYYTDVNQTTTHHFNYSFSTTVLERILSALQTPALDPHWQLLKTSSTTQRSVVPSTAVPAKGIVVFIPGLLGSELLVEGRPVWLDESALHWGDFSRLKQGNAVTVGNVISNEYQTYWDYLNAHYQVVPFAYDWRQSTSQAVTQLAALLKQLLQVRNQQGLTYPIRIVAHSAGGLVAWGLVQTEPLLWQRLTVEADTRVLLLGTLLQGTARIAQWFYGEERFIDYLDIVEGRAKVKDAIANQLASYQGLVDLLPNEYLVPENWQERKSLEAGFNECLANAKTYRSTLQQESLNLDRVLYVRGEGNLTPVQRTQDGKWQATRYGDGMVAWVSIPSALAQWQISLEHGLMLSNARYFSAFTELLEQGHTTALPRVLPTVPNETLAYLPASTPSLYPTIELIRAAAFGYHTLETRASTLPPVELWIAQGNLEHVSRVLVVGHYEGNGIVSAESALDQRLNGRLRELYQLGIYPAALNSAELIFNQGKQPAGALVIGLGEVGKLTTQRLTSTFTQGLLRYAMSQFSTVKDSSETSHFTQNLDISSLLVGTQASGLSLREGLIAILRAVQQANAALLKLAGAQTALRFQSLEFVELYADKAIEAAKQLQDLIQQTEFRDEFSLSSWVRNLPGGYSRVVYSEASGWWQRLQITGSTQGLSFLALTERARAEALLQPTQRQLVDQLVAKAINQPIVDATSCEIGKVLFEMLLPNTLKEQALRSDHWVLVLNSEAATYPWELLQNRYEPDQVPLSVRTGLIRQLQTTQFRQTVLNPTSRSALVVGDPILTQLPRLAAARQEAHSVANLLEQYGFNDLVREIDTAANSIICALHNREVRVLHLAGHGVYRYDRGDGELVTGMVIGDQEFLTAVEIEQMRQVPELVFVNCCHLGKVDTLTSTLAQAAHEERHQFASSFAESLIAMGVRAVIVAGWAISDLAAQLFAETYYRALLEGKTFGDAVLQARHDTWQLYPNTNTWGAYQCYGDPDYRLVQEITLGEDSSEYVTVPQFIAPIEVSTELDNLISASDSLRLGEYQWLLNKVNLIAQVTPTEWLKEASLLSRLGRVYSKLDQFPQSIQTYKQALYAEKAEYLMSTWDDLVSVLTAYALQLHQDPSVVERQPFASTPQELMTEAFAILTQLDQLTQVVSPPQGFVTGSAIGQTQNRLEEKAKYFKRLSMMQVGQAQTDVLKQMEQAYAETHAYAWNLKYQIAPYPLVNWLTCRLVRYHRQEQLLTSGDWDSLKEWLARVESEANKQEQQAPTFLAAVNQAEVLLVRYLMPEGRPAMDTIIQYYEKALERGAPPRRIRFVSEHLDFLTLMLQNALFVEAELKALQELKVQLKQRWQLLPIKST